MSIVIPAEHLARTVITVRYDSPHAAPHIECALDEHTHVGGMSREHPNSPHAYSLDGRSPASSSSTLASPMGALGMIQADLSVDRGMDHRGHYVRLSFLSGHRTQRSFGQRPLQHEMNDASLLSLGNGPLRPATNVPLPPEGTPSPSATSTSHSIGGSPLAYSSTPIMNNMPPVHQDADSSCLDHMDFMCSTDPDLITALDSFMGFFDNQHYPMLDGGVTGGITQELNQITEPLSPELSSSSSSSCASSSPISPCDFLPASTPSCDGSAMGGSNHIDLVQNSPDRPPEKSPAIPHLVPGPEPKVVTPTNKTESRLLPCPQPGCKRQFKSTSTLGGHLKTHAGKGIRFQCSFPPCTEKFSRRHDQLRHEVYKHGKQCEWVCNRCNSFFSYERSLEKHTCTMDKSRRGSMPYAVTGAPGSRAGSGSGR